MTALQSISGTLAPFGLLATPAPTANPGAQCVLQSGEQTHPWNAARPLTAADPVLSTDLDRALGTLSPVPGLSIHVERQGDGVSVWLRLHPQAMPALPRIQSELQAQLRQRGLRLTALICNGQPVDPSRRPLTR